MYTMLNTSGLSHQISHVDLVKQELCAYTDLIVPNIKETLQLTGINLASVVQGDEANKQAACEQFIKFGCKNVVITLANKGACTFESGSNKFTTQDGCLVEEAKVIDRIGVGDCFLGALSYLVSVGTPLQDAVKISNYLASLSLQKSGGTNLHENKFPEKTALVDFKM